MPKAITESAETATTTVPAVSQDNNKNGIDTLLLAALQQSGDGGQPLVRNERMYESIRQNEYDFNSALGELPDYSGPRN